MTTQLINRPGDSGPGGKNEFPDDQQQLIQTISRLPVTNFIPPEGLEFRPAAYVPIPAIGASAIVVQFTVKEGNNGILNFLGNVFVGGGFTEGQGGIVWRLFQDFNEGAVVQNFDNIVASLGSVNNPGKLNGIRIKENQVVALQVTNVSIVVSGQFIGGLLGGYEYPIELEDVSMGF